MYKQFKFEGEVHDLLDCVPLTVRRKLDLVALKISLEGWQALPRAERLSLCHLPVDTASDLAMYAEVMRAFCSAHRVPLKPLQDPDAEARTWSQQVPPARLVVRAVALGVDVAAAWPGLDEECRYALVKLSDPKRDPAKLPAALVELGLLQGPVPQPQPSVAVCTPAPSAR
jgi:hypothetical protein